jgi:putative endonuclease
MAGVRYYKAGDSIEGAIQREKTIKHWPLRWKIALIDGMNPNWDDLPLI